MRSSTSPQMRSGELTNMSSVWLMTPSVEFSIGTTPKCAAPDSTSRNTSSMPASGTVCTECPKCLNAAAWVKVPSGPRNAICIGISRARQADMISRNRRAISSLLSGP